MAKFTTASGREIDSWDIYDYLSPTEASTSFDHTKPSMDKQPDNYLDWADPVKGNQWKYYDSDLKGSSREWRGQELPAFALQSLQRQAKDYWGESKDTWEGTDLTEKPEHLLTNADRREIVGKDFYNKSNFKRKDGGTFVGGYNVPDSWVKSQVGKGSGDSYYAWTPHQVDFAQWHEGFWNPDYQWTGQEYNYSNPYGKAATSFISEYAGDEREGKLQVTADQLHFVENDLGYSISDEGVVNPFQWDTFEGGEWSKVGDQAGLYTTEVLTSLFDTDTWRGLTIEQKSALQGAWSNQSTGYQDVTDFKDEYLPYESDHWEAMLTQEQRENWGLDIARTYDDEYWKADDFGLLQDQSETFNLFRDLNVGAVDYDYYNQDADLIAAAKRLDPTFSETVGFTSVNQIRKAQLEEKQFEPEPVATETGTVDVGMPDDLAEEFTITEDNPYIGVDDSVTGKPEDAPTLDDYEEQQEADADFIKDVVEEANVTEADQEDAEAVIESTTQVGDQIKTDEVYGDEIDTTEDLLTGQWGDIDYQEIQDNLDFSSEDIQDWMKEAYPDINFDNFVDSDWVQEQIGNIPKTDTSGFVTEDSIKELDKSQWGFATQEELNNLNTTYGDWDSTLQTWNAGNEVIANMMKQAGEQAASDAERNRVIASYGSQGKPINKIVKGVRTINELNNPLLLGDWGGPKQSFNRKGMRISNLNV